MPEKENKAGRANGAVSGGAVASVQNFLKSTTSKSTALSVLDKSWKFEAKANPVPIMKSHVGASNVINVQKSFAPVVPSPPITAAQKVAVVAGKINEVSNTISKPLIVIGVAIDTFRIGWNIRKDIKRRSSRNTVTTVATVAAGWGGGFGGGIAGAAAGTAIFPVIGTLVGGIIGGVAGGIGGSIGTGAIVDVVGNKLDYDIKICICTECEKEFKCRVYITGLRIICDKCEAKQAE